MSTSSATARDLSQYNAALTAFEDLLRIEAKKHQVPRQTDPKAAALLDTLTDAGRHLEATDYDFGDLAKLIKTCARTHIILVEYIMFTMRDEPTFESLVRDNNTREIEILVDKSFNTFQPEMGRLEVFLLLCNGKAISLANDFSSNPLKGQALEYFRRGIELFRESTFKVYAASSRRILNTALPMDYRLKLASALSITAPTYSLILTPELQDEILRRLKQGGDALHDEMKAQIDEIVERMSSVSCIRLCSY
jgi:hypothetical protein